MSAEVSEDQVGTVRRAHAVPLQGPSHDVSLEQTHSLGASDAGSSGDRRRHQSSARRSWTDPVPFDIDATESPDPVAASGRRRRTWVVPMLRRAFAGDALVAALVIAGCVLSLPFPEWRGAGVTAVAMAAAVALWTLALWVTRAYESRRVGDGPDEFQSILQAALLMVAAFGVVAYTFQLLLPRRLVLVAVPLVAIGTVLHRYQLRRWLHAHRDRGQVGVLRTLVVGEPIAVQGVATDLARESHHGMQVVGACIPLPGSEVDEGLTAPVLGGISEVPQVVVDHAVDSVVVVGSQLSGPALRRLSWALEQTGADLVVAPGLVEVTGPSVTLKPTAGLSLLHVERPSSRYGRLLGKALLDRTLGVLLLLCALPVIAGAAVAVRLTSTGPAFFPQVRVGLDGRHFTMWKLRTMVVGADTMVADLAGSSDRDGLMFKMHADPRVTRVGRRLRQLSLDELPQLWNVVRGDMSLVGPRPPLVREYVAYHDSVHRRLRVRPGLTGLWQVSGRADLTWEESMRLDLRYVDNWSLAMDVLILWKTGRAVVRGRGAY